MVTLKEIYESVLETYPGDVKEFNSPAIIDHINECYISIRDEYIRNGKFERFTIKKEVPVFIDSREIPYLNYLPLNPPVLQQFNFDQVVLYVICRMHPGLQDYNEWSKGDKAWKEEDLYEAVNDIDVPDTETLTFKRCEVRNFHPANRLKYKVGDVVIRDERYFRAVTTHINDYTDDLDQRPEWEEVFWKYVGIGFVDPEVIDFDQLDRKKVAIDSGSAVVSFDDKNMYVSKGVVSATITYVPVHEWKRKNEDEFPIPDSAITYWKRMVQEKMGAQRGLIQQQNDEG